jgi:hypothetical protein
MTRRPGGRDDKSKRPPDTRPPTDKGLSLPCPYCRYVAHSPRAQLKLDSHVRAQHPDKIG